MGIGGRGGGRREGWGRLGLPLWRGTQNMGINTTDIVTSSLHHLVIIGSGTVLQRFFVRKCRIPGFFEPAVCSHTHTHTHTHRWKDNDMQ